MTRRWTLVSTLALAPLGLSTAVASDVPACGHYGKFSQMQTVEGLILSAGKDWWGGHIFVLQDKHSGCRILVREADDLCVPGRSFSATGHLRTSPGDGYDATFHVHFSNDPLCRV